MLLFFRLSVVCRPKDPYQNRPLPHLIGSKQWNDKWHVGLIESDEEVLSDEEPEEPEFSQSSSDEGDSLSNSPRTSNPQTTSESDFAVPVPAVIHREFLTICDGSSIITSTTFCFSFHR